MPDFSTMTDEQLRKFKSENNRKILELRDESRQAEEALQVLRAAEYARVSSPEYVAEQNAIYAAEQAEAAVEEAARIVAPPADASGRAPQPGS